MSGVATGKAAPASPPSTALPNGKGVDGGALQPLTAFDEQTRARQLRSMKLRAAGLLVAAAVAFALSLYFKARYPWLGWVQAYRGLRRK